MPRASHKPDRKTCSCGGACASIVATPKLARRLRLSRQGFELVVGRPPHGFCCPLCVRELDEGCATEAHAPAKALRGKSVAVVCSACNNYMSQAYEAATIAALVGRAPDDPSEERLTVQFGAKAGPRLYHRAVVRSDPLGNRSITLEPLSDVTPTVASSIKSAGRGELQMTIRYATPAAIRRTFLAWAFLVLFGRFGYTFALSAASRTVRDELLLGRSVMGARYVVSYGALAAHLPAGEATINMLATSDNPDGSHEFLMVGPGVRFGKVVTVCLPASGDPRGERLRVLAGYSDESGQLTRQLAAVPFGDIFEAAIGRSYLDRRCRFAIDEGAELFELVSTTSLEAWGTLADARTPGGKPASASRTRLDASWTARVPPLNTALHKPDWLMAVADDLCRRLVDLGRARDVGAVSEITAGSDPQEARKQLRPLLPRHLERHLDDAFELVEHEHLSEDDVSMEALSDAIEIILRAADPGGKVATGYSEVLLGADPSIVSHAAVFVLDGDELIVGPFYSVRALVAAVHDVVPAWLRRKSEVSDHLPGNRIDSGELVP